ncbi:uncharacterized protein METZ01_LOCUS330837, partial [marine metagenome]
MNYFYKTAESYKCDSFTLPQKYYIDSTILKMEIENIFSKSWLYCGRCDDVSEQGEYKIVEIGNESIIILRNIDGMINAFYNVCRHRGTRICTKEFGKFSNTIQCPYHGWTYDLKGNLHRAPNMEAVSDFIKEDYPLHSVNLIEWEGYIFINFSDESADFHLEYAPVIDLFSAWDMKYLKTIDTKYYHANCNWKLIIQNYSECYHCPLIHPSLSNMTPYTGGMNDMISGPFLGGYMEMNVESITKDGKLCGPLLENSSDKNLSRVYYYTLFPNILLSIHPDYVMIHTVWPEGPETCSINCRWLFSKKVEGSTNYNPRNAINFWDKTNLEDWDIC